MLSRCTTVYSRICRLNRSIFRLKLVLRPKQTINNKYFSSKYAFLSDLGLSSTTVNPGVFNGKNWGTVEPSKDKIKHISSINPTNNETIAEIECGTSADYEICIQNMSEVKHMWSQTPAPKRGDIVRTIGDILREKKSILAKLITVENGKILSEGMGEVQEAIDICDFAVGLSRSLNGQIIPSERYKHMMMECYHPLNGHVGIITAFNFPCAVAFWNTTLSLIAGNTQIWKGASSVPLVTLACSKIIEQALKFHNLPTSIATCITGSGSVLGDCFASDKRMELISFTGSTEIGRTVNSKIAHRFGKSIMELGGNNGAIIMDDADINICVNAVLFSAVGTAGQRCTTLRRLFLHKDIYDVFLEKLLKKYSNDIVIGDPLLDNTLCGPLITKKAVKDFEVGMAEIQQSCADGKSKVLIGGKVEDKFADGNFVQPTVVETVWTEDFVKRELFAPVLYVMKFSSFEEALDMHNSGSVHGLSSSLFTSNDRCIFEWLGPNGSDCGIVNVNIGTSGAEIGGAFGGEKETGCGRESGSDSWKQYMRRTTCTINYSSQLELAQGVKFGDD